MQLLLQPSFVEQMFFDPCFDIRFALLLPEKALLAVFSAFFKLGLPEMKFRLCRLFDVSDEVRRALSADVQPLLDRFPRYLRIQKAGVSQDSPSYFL